MNGFVYPVIFFLEKAWLKRRIVARMTIAHFSYLSQSQLFPQLHSLLSFIGQFLPVFLQVGLSAANAVVQITAARNENRIFV